MQHPRATLAGVLGLLVCLVAPGITAQGKNRVAVPDWIWWGKGEGDQEFVFRRNFDLDAVPKRAFLTGSCDNMMTVFLNDKEVLRHGSWERLGSADVRKHLRKGTNVLWVRASNQGGPAALALRLALGREKAILTDGSWYVTTPDKAAAARAGKLGQWQKATVLGKVGDPSLVWSGSVNAESYGAPPAPAKPVAPQKPAAVDDLHLPEGFRAEILYRVPKASQGSWVSLTRGENGQLFASDQAGKGIFRIEPAALGNAEAVTRVRRIGVGTSGAQGLCWAFGSLYANVNGRGLYRIQDVDLDGRLDTSDLIIPLRGGGEHGPHAVIQTEGGDGLYFIGGNHTDPPKFDSSRAPSNWGEDLLLPRQWDARGHARGKLAPGGWVARCDRDGKNIEIVSSGYRNQYDIALSPSGEMFTYDADMEWDTGTPWYRPTRVCHVVSGSEFGWRSGTGKWPTHYEDSLPPVVDIGPGSPTGVVFGTGARFPVKYQRALYILDWTFGTIYAIHLQPKGASYSAEVEHFLWKKPLPVTDAVVGEDGALYFTVGGRGTQSALYRVVYAGAESTIRAGIPVEGRKARLLRRTLERYHGRAAAGAVAQSWPHLGHADRFVRFAARIAIESQPVAEWRERALAEREPSVAVTALLALARQDAKSAASRDRLLQALDRLSLATLSVDQQLAACRAYALTFIRQGAPTPASRQQLRAKFERLLPAKTDALNNELVRLLTYLQSTVVVPKTLALMRAAKPTPAPAWGELVQRNDGYGGPIARMLADMPPLQNLSYAFMLRNADSGWTLPLREEYFGFFAKAAKHPGGHSYAGFLTNIRREAEAKLSVTERHRLAKVLEKPLIAASPQNVKPPKGPGRVWTKAAALQAIGAPLRGRNYARGRNLYHAALCSTCHRFDGQGGMIGPDLTTVAGKFSVADLVESILEPSKVISDQYGSKVVTLKDGDILMGLVVERDASVEVFQADPKTPPRTVARKKIASIEDSPVSQMPPGLVNTLNAEELKDLVAYLLSGGDKRHAVFRKGRRR